MAKLFAHVTDKQLRAWVLKGRSVRAIAELIGSTPAEVARRVSELWQEAERKASYKPPTEEEIEERCREIRSRWSEEERLRRAGIRSAGVEVTVVPESCLSRPKPGRR